MAGRTSPGRPPGRAKTGGRQKGVQNKSTRELKDYANKFTQKAIDNIVKKIDSKDEDISLRASDMLLNRAHGRPAQAITGPEGEPLDFGKLSIDELVALAGRLDNALASAKTP